MLQKLGVVAKWLLVCGSQSNVTLLALAWGESYLSGVDAAVGRRLYSNYFSKTFYILLASAIQKIVSFGQFPFLTNNTPYNVKGLRKHGTSKQASLDLWLPARAFTKRLGDWDPAYCLEIP